MPAGTAETDDGLKWEQHREYLLRGAIFILIDLTEGEKQYF
jgi:hypothetical protein